MHGIVVGYWEKKKGRKAGLLKDKQSQNNFTSCVESVVYWEILLARRFRKEFTF